MHICVIIEKLEGHFNHKKKQDKETLNKFKSEIDLV